MFLFSINFIAAAIAAISGVFSTCWLVYKLYFHPLAKYPGPFLARITTLYAAYHGWKGDIHLDMWRCHERYGNYVRYKPDTIIFNTAEALNDIYRRPGVVVKSKVYLPMVHRAPNTFSILGGRDHARRRRIMAQGMSDKAIRGYEPRIKEHIRKFCDVLGSGEGEPKDMSLWCNYLSFDIMADVIFSAKYDLLGSDRFRHVCRAIDDSNVRVGALIQAGSWASLKTLEKTLFKKAIIARNLFIRFVTHVVSVRLEVARDDKKKDKEDRSLDVFGILQEAKDPETGDGFTLDEISAESTTLIVAGSDTTSTSICSALYYLAHNPACYARVAAEIRSTFSRFSDINLGPALTSCSYLRACIDEAFRMSPAVGSSLFREVVSNGATISGHTIPAGYDVGVGLYSIHHNQDYFDDPFTYRPERWIPGEGETTHATVERGLSVLNPFSLGLRSCLGKALATAELQLALATVIYAYDFELADGELGRIGSGRPDMEYGRHRNHEYQLYDHITSQKSGPFLTFKPRNGT